ncbi:MAG: SDR family oxidoreductase [Anaerolineales bacterium]|nr:MAG: SDR family oxidoreductase [Anaerolineales bacterium]
MSDTTLTGWALILGASSGFGAATSRALASAGMDIVGIHLDLKATRARADEVRADVEAAGRSALFINMNAADAGKRAMAIERMKEEGVKVKVMLHSLAFGTLKPLVADTREESLDQRQMEMTLDVMANSLVYWVQDLAWADLFDDDARIFAMTSEGNQRVMPTYGAVSGAKVALESHMRQLAYELAPRNIKANTIQAGVTDTPALRQIPVHGRIIEASLRRNPYHRLTRPEDVASAIVAFSQPELAWMTGNVIRVDGGECIAP